ncbi:MAG: hypothetical protein J5526_00610 [Bacteroidales bacterium]|nr:hypothetical protein [Bacteroidales bacterium]
MKRQVIFAALMAILCAMSVSCSKGSNDDDIVVTRINAHKIEYSIDDTPQTALIGNRRGLYNFMEDMVFLAQRGHRIIVQSENRSKSPSKDVESYNTRSRKNAINWCVKMHEAGYTVELTYDESAKTYHCRASK